MTYSIMYACTVCIRKAHTSSNALEATKCPRGSDLFASDFLKQAGPVKHCP